jgi:phospholipid transport system substrate-binding protein
MLNRRKLLATSGFLGVALCIGMPLRAAIAPDARAFVQTLGNRAMKLLSDGALSPDQRTRDLRQLLMENFDLDRIGTLALGRFGKQATGAQQQEYRSLFVDFIVKTYSARLNEQSWNSFTVLDTRQAEGGDMIVGSESTAKGQAPSRVEWRVHSSDAGLRIIDVTIGGISMVMTQRDEFASVIQSSNGGIAQLLQQLRQKTSELN